MTPTGADEFLPRQYFSALVEKRMLLFIVLAAASLGVLASVSAKMALAISGLMLLLIFILPRPIRGLYIIVACLPFEGLTALRPDFSIVKIITVIVFIAWSIGLIRTKLSSIQPGRSENIFLLCFCGFAVMSLVGALNFSLGLSRLITLFLLVAFYFLVSDLASEEKTLKTILLILVASSLLAAVFAIGEFLLDTHSRVEGALASEAQTAIFLSVLVPLVVYFLSQATGRRRLLLWSVFFVMCAGVIVTRSRGPLVALVIMLLLIALSRLTDMKIRRVLFAVLLIAALLAPISGSFDARFSVETIMSSKGAGRFNIWSKGYQIFSDNWLFGVGFGNFSQVYVRYAAHEPSFPAHHILPRAAHNTFIEEAAETGVLGIISFLGFIGFSLRSLHKANRYFFTLKNINQARAGSMLFISIIGFLVSSLAYTSISMKIGWLLLALAASQVNLARMAWRYETASKP